ncbi:MAG: HsmA family protein [Candidatus Thermoplasmatota archaeon]|nr:HsmA family protein [Candidatus Thermoplasmatota archaeon]
MKTKVVLGSIGAVFVVFLMVSSATAVHCVNSQPVSRVIEKIEKTRNLYDVECMILSNLNTNLDSNFRVSNFEELISKVNTLGENDNLNELSNETILKIAVILILLALTCYSVGVFSEKISGRLKPWHVVAFWVGLLFDTTGTALMSTLSDDDSESNFLHLLTGIIAIGSMAFHAILASIVLRSGNEKLLTKFPNFSLFIWVIWLLSFVTGMFLNMNQDDGSFLA